MSIRPLPPALAEKARLELNEDPKKMVHYLQHLKDWIAKQPHLKARTGLALRYTQKYDFLGPFYQSEIGAATYRKDDQWLVAFLRGCKYSLEKTKEKLDIHYTIRYTAPELHKIKHTDTRFEEVFSLGAVLTLPKTSTIDGPRITLIRPGKYDASKYDISDIISMAHTLQKVMFMDDDNAIVAGTTVIQDLEGVTLGHFLQMTPTTMKKMVVAGQDAIPIRLKGTHYLNAPPGFETIFMAMKSLLNEKNRNRLYVHGKNSKSLYKYVPKEILPNEYGGDGETTEAILEGWRKKIKEYHTFLEEDWQYGTDESMRFGKPKTPEAMFGLEGSFRQLDVD